MLWVKSCPPAVKAADVVRPKDCAFLVTVPTTREEFLEDVENPAKDFVRERFSGSALRPANQWTLYEPTVLFLAELLAEIQRLGANVVRRATLEDWRAACASSEVIILFAHWRSARLKITDLDWERLKEAPPLTAPEQQPVAALLEDLRAGASRGTILRRLNELLADGRLGSHPWFDTPGGATVSTERRIYANRTLLASMLPGAFKGGARVEFGDVVAGIEEVAAACEAGFKGIIDLSVCTSTLLGEMIKVQAPQALVVATALPTILDFRVAFYRAVFNRLRSGRSYVATLTELGRQMIPLAGELQQ